MEMKSLNNNYTQVLKAHLCEYRRISDSDTPYET